ncbi:MAG: radical SAM protein [Candidatus Omnitrophota bacterium]
MVRNIVKQSRDFSGKYRLVSFMGHGEPLLNKALPGMVKAVHDTQITQRIEIITNASLLTCELSAALIDAGLTNLRISLQGVNADAYRRISNRKLDYEKLLEQIEYYYKHKKQGGVFVKVLDISLGSGEDKQFTNSLIRYAIGCL